ncbi:hypothetical protein Q8A73_017251 [Channa argus]|nr:hypothetical protein Q8A73_017251 [Channa argus]
MHNLGIHSHDKDSGQGKYANRRSTSSRTRENSAWGTGCQPACRPTFLNPRQAPDATLGGPASCGSGRALLKSPRHHSPPLWLLRQPQTTALCSQCGAPLRINITAGGQQIKPFLKTQVPVEIWSANTNEGEPLKIHEEIITGRCPTFFSAAAPPLPWGDSFSKQRGLTPQHELTLPPRAVEGAGGPKTRPHRSGLLLDNVMDLNSICLAYHKIISIAATLWMKVSHVATVCIVGVQVTEYLSRLCILLGFNGVDRGAPTCGRLRPGVVGFWLMEVRPPRVLGGMLGQPRRSS